MPSGLLQLVAIGKQYDSRVTVNIPQYDSRITVNIPQHGRQYYTHRLPAVKSRKLRWVDLGHPLIWRGSTEQSKT